MPPARTGEDDANDHSQSDLTEVAMGVAVEIEAAADAAAAVVAVVRQPVRRYL